MLNILDTPENQITQDERTSEATQLTIFLHRHLRAYDREKKKKKESNKSVTRRKVKRRKALQLMVFL